jgi:hypothetical protein
MGGGGGYDIGLSASMASSATSGLQGNFSNLFGAKSAGGLQLPVWLPFALIGGAVLVAVAWIVTRN